MRATKTCTKCGQTKPIQEFPLCRGQHRARCNPCHVSDVGEWQRRNRDRVNKAHRERRWAKYGKPRPPYSPKERWILRIAARTKWMLRNPGAMDAARRKWCKRNPHKQAANCRLQQARRRRAVPKWANHKAMRKFYAEARRLTFVTGVPHEVDHIVPITSEIVCGLHCEANLRVISKRDNRQKHNRHWPDMP